MPKQKSGEQLPMRSAERLLSVLRAFSHERPRLRVSEISEEMGLAYSTVRRIMSVLEKHRFVRLDPETRSYVVHSEVVRLAQVATWESSVATVAAPLVERLHDETAETVILSTRTGVRVVRLLSQSTKHALKVDTHATAHRPLYIGSATGKALLAWVPREELLELLPETWPPLTQFTTTDRDTYLSELDDVRERGYAINNQQTELGVWAVAVPVFDNFDAVAAALTIPVPVTRLDRAREKELIRLSVDAARELTASVQWSPTTGSLSEELA